MKAKQQIQSRWIRTWGAFFCLLLMCSNTTTAYANADRAAGQLHNFHARVNWQAPHQESRVSHRDNRHELHIQPFVSSKSLQINNHNNYPAIDSVVLFPGQVSTFHTSRPHTVGAASSRSSRTTYINDLGNERNLRSGLNLDLSSTQSDITVGSKLLTAPVSIDVGGQTKEITAGSKVTAAEFAALSQKLSGGDQLLTLSSAGAADGGNLNLNQISDNGSTIKTSALVVPHNVSVTGDFARTADGVRVTNDLINYGSIVAVSSHSNKDTAVIGARDINNEQGGSIASQSSSANPMGLNLALRADRDLNNQGSIKSSGDLELSAGHSVNNASATSVIEARGNVLLNAPEINNQGSISSIDKNVTMASAPDANLAVNNLGGNISALNGAINIRTPDYAGSASSTVSGGNLFSKDLNINAGQGTANVAVNQLTGLVNTSGNAAHVSANTSDLILGTQCLTGDPTYYNTGNIILGGNINVGEKIAIIAGGDITTNQANLTIRAHSGVSGQGFDINIVAGANVVAGSGEISPAGGPATLPAQTLPATQNTTAPVTFSGTSASGGNIDLQTATTLSISSASDVGNLNGGNITLAAYANGLGNKGQILVANNSNAQIDAGGNGSGTNGNITIVAGATSGTAIQLGLIKSSTGTTSTPITGKLVISNSQPDTSDSSPITFGTTGAITSGNSIVPSLISFGGINVGSTINMSGSVSILSGGTTALGGITSGSSLSVLSDGALALNGNLVAPGGIIVNSSGAITTPGAFSANANGVGLSPNGNISISFGSGVTFIGGTLNLQATGGLPGTGSIDLFGSFTDLNIAGNLTITAGSYVHATLSGGGIVTAGGVPGSVSIVSGGEIVVPNIFSNALPGGQPGGAVTLNTTSGTGQIVVGTIFTNGSGGNTAGAVSLLSGGALSFNSITANSGPGATAVTLTSVDSNIAAAPIDSPSAALTIHLLGSSPGNFTSSGVNNVSSLSGTGGGTITYDNSSNPLQIGTLGTQQSLVATTSDSVTGIVMTQTINTGGTLTLNTPRFFNNQNIIAASVTVQNLTGNLVVDAGAGGVLTGQVPTAGSPGNPSVPAAIIFNTVNGGNLGLFGDMAMFGDVAMNNVGGTTTSNDLSLFHGTNNVTLTTDTWTQVGSGNITGNNFRFAGVEIINPDGDVSIPGSLTFLGRDLAIVAKNNINIAPGTIDLSSATGNSGSLTLIAGFDFTPTGGGQQQTALPFTLGGPSVLGGSISAPTVQFLMKSTGASGSGGNFLAVAQGGTVNPGAINLGAIDTSSTNGSGGSVNVIGSGNMFIGFTVKTTGLTGGGNVSMAVANPLTVNSPGPIIVSTGHLTGGSFAIGAPTVGTFRASTIDTGDASIFLSAGNGATLTLINPLTAHTIGLSAPSGQIVMNSSLLSVVTAPLSGDGGTINFNAATFGVPGGNLSLQATGTGAGRGGSVTYTSSSDVVVGIGGNVFVTATGPGGGGSATIQSAGNVTINSGGIDVSGSNGAGGTIDISAAQSGTGTLTINDTFFLSEANATGNNGSGGKISLSTQLASFTNSFGAPLVLAANGIGTGNGGEVSYTTHDSTQTFIGNPVTAPKAPVNFLSLSANSGSSGSGGNGGIIAVETDGNITVDTATTTARPLGTNGNGGTYSFIAHNPTGKTGSLIVLGDLDASGTGTGTDGFITLGSDNKKVFAVGTTKTPKNGVFGALTAASITVQNQSGAVSVLNSTAMQGQNITLSAGGKGGILEGKGVTITSTNILSLSAASGSIGKKPLIVSAQNLNLATTAGGAINVSDTFAGLVSVNSQITAGKSLTLTTAGALTLADDINSNGSINITSGGSLTLFDDVTTQSGSIAFTASGGTLSLSNHMTANNGGIVLSNSDTANGDINIAAGSIIETALKGGDVVIAIGAPPKKGSGPNLLAGFTVSPPIGKVNAFFGPDTADVVSGGNVPVVAKNANVIFNNLTTGAKQIFVGNGAQITADPPSKTASQSPFINSLPVSIEFASTAIGTTPQASKQATAVTFDSSLIGRSNANLLDAAATASSVGLSDDVASSLTTNSLVTANAGSAGSVASANGNYVGDTTRLLSIATVGDTGYATTDGNATDIDTAGESSNLLVNAAFHSDRETGLNQFAVENVASINMSDVAVTQLPTSKRHVLSKGNIVFAPFRDTTIETPHGIVKLCAGSIAIVMQSENGLAVYDLHDQRRNAVVVNTGDQQFSLSPGRSVLVSKQATAQLEDINPLELVQYRGLSQSQLKNGFNVFTSEFSIPSACYALKPLKQLMVSKHHEAANMAKRIMKTTAIIMTLSPDHGDFVQVFKPRTTAMIP